MKILSVTIITGLMSLCFIDIGMAQGKVTDFKSLKTEGEYGGVKLIITPLSFDPYQEDFQSKKYRYGVRFCYTYDGETKAARQDMTYDIYNHAEYDFTLAYGDVEPHEVEVFDIEYFNLDDLPRDQWPTKEACFEN